MKVNFYWCEDVVEQANNKVMLIGLFSDRHIIVSEEYVNSERAKVSKEQEASLGLDKLTVLINASGAEGNFVATGQFYSPDGSPHGPLHDLGTMPIIKNRSANIIFQALPFPFQALGKYKLVVKIGDEEFESDCIIDID